MHGYMSKLGNPFLTQWQRRYFYLFPNRLEWRGEGESPVRGWQKGPGEEVEIHACIQGEWVWQGLIPSV